MQREPDAERLAAAADIVDAARRIVVLTGAGISTDSGIPDFRGPNGLWTKDPAAEKASNIRHYVNDPEVRQANWARRATGELWADVNPNDGHRALVALQDRNKLLSLITQNVDELHQRAGVDAERVIEIHGTTRKVACLGCEYRDDMHVALERVRRGEADPDCPSCGGLLKSATVSFGQNLNPDDLDRAQDAAFRSDVFLAVGSSLQVYPINEAVPLAVQSGARLIIVNAEPTPFDHLADVILNSGISQTLPRLCGWSPPL